MTAAMGLKSVGHIIGISVLGVVLMGAVPECFSTLESESVIYDDEVPTAQANYTPQWAGEGTSLVFGNRETLYRVDTGGSRLQRVSNVSSYGKEWDVDLSPDVSQNGSRVAYATLRHGTGSFYDKVHSFEIVTADLDGSNVQRLTENESLETNPVWSPDGSRIAFLSDQGNFAGQFQLYTMADDGSDVRSVAPSVRAYGLPAV